MPNSSENSTTFEIVLTPFFESKYTVGNYTGYRLRVVASNAVGLSENVFRYIRSPGGKPGETIQEFNGVCSAVDMAELPENEPLEKNSKEFFRMNEVDLLFRSTQETVKAWEVITKEVSILLETLERTIELDAGTLFEIDNPIPQTSIKLKSQGYVKLQSGGYLLRKGSG